MTFVSPLEHRSGQLRDGQSHQELGGQSSEPVAMRGMLLIFSLILGAFGAGCELPLRQSRLVVWPAVDTLWGIGATVQLTASVGAPAATGPTASISWTSLNGGVATVDSLGTVRAVAAGTALIVAALGGLADTATLVVLTGSPLVVDAGADQTISLGAAAPLNATVTSTRSGQIWMFWSKISGPGTTTFAHENWTASFENGTISEWMADSGGSLAGGNGPSVSREQAHSGFYSWKAYDDPNEPPPDNYSAKLIRFRFDYSPTYYSAWYYWPADYVIPDGQSINILQFKERSAPYDPTWIVAVKASASHPGVTYVNLYDWHGKVAYDTPDVVPVPKGRWFQVVVWQKLALAGGELVVWLDGVPLFHLTNVNTLGNASNVTPPYMAFGVGNYGPAGIGKFLYVDDAAVVADVGSLPPTGFVTQDARNTSVQFSEPGTYVLRLTASDGQAAVSDDIQITVR